VEKVGNTSGGQEIAVMVHVGQWKILMTTIYFIASSWHCKALIE